MIDLHIHTTCSDGGLTPREVVDRAARAGLRAIAITDHDGVDGNAEAEDAGRELGVAVVPGVEISTRWDDLTIHLLGYGLRRITGEIRETLARLVRSREERNPRMVQKLREMGIDITMEEVLAEANGSLVGRPHFARVLVRKGVFRSVQEAFDRVLGRGRPAYVDKERLTPTEACAVIRRAGGIPVLAHPGLIEEERPGALPPLLAHLLELGLGGIEAYYSRHTPGQTRRYRALARSRGLLVTGGSDFHRPGEGGPEIGTGFGDLRVPDACYEALAERLEGR